MARPMRDGMLIIGERGAAPAAPVRAAAAGQVLAGARRGARPAPGAAGQVERVWVAMEDSGRRRRGEIIEELSDEQ
eukprot:8254265-Karenia_brevis.AAC.1